MDQASPAETTGIERMDVARQAMEAGRFDEALEGYDWLWCHLLESEPGMQGVRVSFLATDMSRLCESWEPARQLFRQRRDEAEGAAGADTPEGLDARLDWLVLNEVVNETDRSLAWFDSTELADLPQPFFARIRNRLVPPLRRHGRFGDIGRLYPDALDELQNFHELLAEADRRATSLPPAHRQLSRQAAQQLFQEQAALLTRSLRAAERPEQAEALARRAQELDDSADMAAALAAATV